MTALPRWVAVDGNARAGVIHLASCDGLWRANNWSGCLGAFATEAEAEAAVSAAPPEAKHKREPKPAPPEALRWHSMTDNESAILCLTIDGGA